MTVVRFLTLTGGSGLSLRVGCVGNLKTLDCIIFSVGFLRISVRVFEDFTIEDIYGHSLLLPPGNSFDTELARCSGPVMRRRSSYLWKLNSCRNNDVEIEKGSTSLFGTLQIRGRDKTYA
jgi:hypothetical protein